MGKNEKVNLFIPIFTFTFLCSTLLYSIFWGSILNNKLNGSLSAGHFLCTQLLYDTVSQSAVLSDDLTFPIEFGNIWVQSDT